MAIELVGEWARSFVVLQELGDCSVEYNLRNYEEVIDRHTFIERDKDTDRRPDSQTKRQREQERKKQLRKQADRQNILVTNSLVVPKNIQPFARPLWSFAPLGLPHIEYPPCSLRLEPNHSFWVFSCILSLPKTCFYSRGNRTGRAIEWPLLWAALYKQRHTMQYMDIGLSNV